MTPEQLKEKLVMDFEIAYNDMPENFDRVSVSAIKAWLRVACDRITAATREECAQVCDNLPSSSTVYCDVDRMDNFDDAARYGFETACEKVATAIRSKNKEV